MQCAPGRGQGHTARISALEGERKKVSELEQSLETSRSETAASQRDLLDYRAKARKILEEKEKFIVQLRSGQCEADQSNLLEAEVEQVTRERNLYHEETLNLSSHLRTARQEVANCQELLEEKAVTHRQLVTELTKQVQAEAERREEVESDLSQQSEEVRHIR